jgi:hypothetical protein
LRWGSSLVDPLRLRHRLTPRLRRSDGRGPTGPAPAPRLIGGLRARARITPSIERRGIHAGGVAPRLHSKSMRARRALPARRLDAQEQELFFARVLTTAPALRHAADHAGLSTLSLRSRSAPSGPRPSERLRYDPLKQIGLDDERKNQRGPTTLLNSPPVNVQLRPAWPKGAHTTSPALRPSCATVSADPPTRWGPPGALRKRIHTLSKAHVGPARSGAQAPALASRSPSGRRRPRRTPPRRGIRAALSQRGFP